MTNERTDPEAMYDELVTAIVKAVPGIRWKICHHGEQADCEHRWQWRKITLEDVLFAIAQNDEYLLFSMSKEIPAFGMCSNNDRRIRWWHLGNDLAWHKDNAPETIAFLHSHICT